MHAKWSLVANEDVDEEGEAEEHVQHQVKHEVLALSIVEPLGVLEPLPPSCSPLLLREDGNSPEVRPEFRAGMKTPTNIADMELSSFFLDLGRALLGDELY
jgi:hypothetical protein